MRNGGLNPFSDLLIFLRYLSIFHRERPKAYLSWTAKPNIYGALAARVMGVPAFPNVSGLGTAFIRAGLLQTLLTVLYKIAFAKAPAVFFQNHEDSKMFVDRRLVRSEQVRVLPGSGVNLEEFRFCDLERRPQIEPVFLYVGRLLGDKGVRELAAAASLVKAVHPGARFELLGSVGAENRTAISQSELNEWTAKGLVEYLGSATDVRPHLARADAIILPSYREGMSRSLLEAAAIGRPMLASHVPGNREIVCDGVNGLLFEVRSADAIASACERFINMSAEERRQMGEAARRTVEMQFSEEQVFKAYHDVLNELTLKNQAMRRH
jgi:glycosyltransferase involved in cell wall biosynthesis